MDRRRLNWITWSFVGITVLVLALMLANTLRKPVEIELPDTSGTQDAWSDPDAEWEGVKAASQAWNLFEPTDLPSCPPDAGRPLADCGIGYHRREGGHALTRWDWMRFLDCLDRHAE